MNIFTAPDRTQYPDSLDHQICNELEALTGADLCISPFPLEPDEITLSSHIKAGALFVQIKIETDLINSFDGLKSSIARMQACKIPKGQAILLPIGKYYEDNGKVRIVGVNKEYTTNTEWDTLLMLFEMWDARGGIVSPLWPETIDDLPQWIERKARRFEKLELEGDRELWPDKYTPNFNPDDVFQVLKPVQPDDPRYIMVAGLKGYGEKKANSTAEYITNELNIPGIKIEFEDGQIEYEIPLYYFWKVLTDEDDKGKAIHNIPGWGDKSRKDFRSIIGLRDGQNLSVTGKFDTYINGWKTYGEYFRQQIEKRGGNEAGKIWEEMMLMSNELLMENEE